MLPFTGGFYELYKQNKNTSTKESMNVIPTIRGRNSRIGAVCYDGNRLAFLAGYNECNKCGVRGKVVMDLSEAREFSKRFGGIKEPLGAKIIRRLAKHYGI
jgi:hypothetical protein